MTAPGKPCSCPPKIVYTPTSKKNARSTLRDKLVPLHSIYERFVRNQPPVRRQNNRGKGGEPLGVAVGGGPSKRTGGVFNWRRLDPGRRRHQIRGMLFSKIEHQFQPAQTRNRLIVHLALR